MHHTSRYSLAAIPLLMLFTMPVLAQRVPTGGPPADRTNTDRIRQQQMSNREWQLRNYGTEPNAPKDRRQLDALMAQTAEDFDRILTLHNEIARMLATSKPIEYTFISETTAEIKKRASRIQSSLGLHQLPGEAQVGEKSAELDDSQMKKELVRMCNEIRNFVTNPVIANPNTVDAQQLSNARRDLESLIQVSGHLQKEATKMHKQHKETF